MKKHLGDGTNQVLMILKRIWRKLYLLVGMAMAAYEDFCRGALLVAIAYSSSLLPQPSNAATLLAQLALGSAAALGPDLLDVLWFKRAASGKEKGDHHENWSHRPLFMFLLLSPLIPLSLWHDGGVWVGIIYAGFATHYIHDHYPFGDGYINLWWPLPPAKHHHPNIPMIEWIESRWLIPTLRSVGEIMVGTLELTIALSLVGHAGWTSHLIVLVLMGLFVVWAPKKLLLARRS